jgi:hypothetical protein
MILKGETESKVISAQDQALQTKSMMRNPRCVVSNTGIN